MVQFDNYSGPPFIEENPTIVPIVPVERKIDMNAMQNLEVIYYYLQILLLKGLQREHLDSWIQIT
jgi:hypothetical protein